MFDLIINEDISDRQLLVQLLHRMHAMALDFTKLNAAVDRSTGASEAVLAALAAAQPDPEVEKANQAKLDEAAIALDNESGKVEASLPTPAPVAG